MYNTVQAVRMGKLIVLKAKVHQTFDLLYVFYMPVGSGRGREAVETIAQLCMRNLRFFNAQAYAVSII